MIAPIVFKKIRYPVLPVLMLMAVILSLADTAMGASSVLKYGGLSNGSRRSISTGYRLNGSVHSYSGVKSYSPAYSMTPYAIPIPVNGTCGTSNGGIFDIKPSDDLCTNRSTPSNVTGSGPWNWICAGINGGTYKTCSASPSTYVLSATFAGSGGGSIHGDISCDSSSTCLPVALQNGITANLAATPNAISTFGGWSGACSNLTGNCPVTMTTARSVTATFNKAPKAKIGATPYESLNLAYLGAAASDSIILALDTELTESLNMDSGKLITLIGGYRADYSGKSGLPTVLKGVLTIGSGSLTVEGLVVK